jgi:TonB family protein
MELWEFLRQWRSGRMAAGIAASLLLHVLLVAGALWGLQLPSTLRAKPGDALMVELPNPEEPAPAGMPDAPPVPPVPARAPVAAPPAAKPEAPAQRRVASAPRAPEPAKSSPRPAEPARAAERAPEPAPRVPAARAPATASGASAPESEPDSRPAASAPAAPRPEGGERQVASVPPGGPPAPDTRALLRRGGGGSGGRGGIEGDPIALDSKDARFSDYLEQVRRRIKERWGYPCAKDPTTKECQYLSAQLVVHFGILKSGQLQFVEVVRSSGYAIYDDYAVNAIRLASPYPPVPSELMLRMKAGSTGTAIGAHFNYIAEATSLTNIR